MLAAQPLDRKGLGENLRTCRETAGLSRPALARRAGLAPETIKYIEAGAVQATTRTLLALVEVPELRFDPRRFGVELPTNDNDGPNCWLAPGYDPLAQLAQLKRILAARGGFLDQALLYLDHQSAADWCAIANQVDYAQVVRSSFPGKRAAEALVKSAGDRGMDLLALGCGNAQVEVSLTQQLLAQRSRLRLQQDVHLYLLDISQPLVSAAFKHASEALGATKDFTAYAIHGDFYELPQYMQQLSLFQRVHRTRAVWLLGGIFGNLENEVLFVRNSLVGFMPGDLLLLDISHAHGSTAEEIESRDPRLNGGLPEGWRQRYDEFLAGPFRRYLPDLREVVLEPRLDMSCCPVAGSYAVEIMARARMRDGTEKQFSAFRVKRHDPPQLLTTMQELGWRPVAGWPYKESAGQPSMRSVFLFQRSEDI